MFKIVITRLISISLCAALLLGICACTERDKPDSSSSESSVTEEAAPEDEAILDFETITAGIDLLVPQELSVTRPLEDIEIDVESYYITGNSDPSAVLLLNGEEVENRGRLGSFGVFAELDEGENIFVFTQGDTEKTVTITRQADNEIYTTDIITKPFPETDEVIRTGESYALRCTAPSGASVTAKIAGQTIELKQTAATAVEGVPARFSAEFVPEDIAVGIQNFGSVTYTLDWQGEKSEYISKGSLFALGDASLIVHAKDVSATVFVEESVESEYFATLKRGAVDIVTEIGADMYKLSMGGWVVKESLEPLMTADETSNKVSSAVYNTENGVETLLLKGTAAAPYSAERTDGQLVFTFYRTNGVDQIDLKGSKLFTDVEASPDGKNTVLTFRLNEDNPLWGYLVEYKDDGILLTFKTAPKLQDGAKPLQGITIAVDPGHGGTDPGALGISRESGAMEKDISLATAKAVRAYLEASGATVLMTRETDDTVDMNKRLEILQRLDVDFVVSLHCNSIPYNSDGTRPSGTEVYYYEDSAAHLAKTVLQNICERTGRNDRGAEQANFKITSNSNAPSVMVEMGFLTNPQEYDKLCDKQEIYDTAASITDAIIEELRP